MRSPKSRYAVLFVTVLGFALRVFYLNERGLWYDEAFAILYSARSFAEMLYGTLTPVGGTEQRPVHPATEAIDGRATGGPAEDHSHRFHYSHSRSSR